MAKTKVKELLDQMEKPFKGIKGKQTKQYAQFMGIVASMVTTMAESQKNTPGMKDFLKRLKGAKGKVKKEGGEELKPKRLTRAERLREKYGGAVDFDKEALRLDKESLKETSQIRETLGDIKEEGDLVYDAMQDSLFGPLSPLIEKSKNFFKGTFKQWIINWKEVVRKRKLDKEAKAATKMQMHVLKEMVDTYKKTDKDISEWAENQLNLLKEQTQKEEDANKRQTAFDEARYNWEKKQGKEQIKWSKKSTNFIKDLLVTTRIGMMAGFIKDMAVKAFDFFTNPKVLAALLGLGLITKYWAATKQIFSDMAKHMEDIWGSVKSIAGNIAEIFKTLAGIVKDAFMGAMGWLYDKLKPVLDPIGNGIMELVGWIKKLLHIGEGGGGAALSAEEQREKFYGGKATKGVLGNKSYATMPEILNNFGKGLENSFKDLAEKTEWLKDFVKGNKKKEEDKISADGEAIVKAIEASGKKTVQVNAPTSVNATNVSSTSGADGGTAPGFGDKVQRAR